jgi:AraC-like DNA-binding protein
MSAKFTSTATGREKWTGGHFLPRHRHEQGYACLVLSGSYEEAGDRGRRVVRAGDVNFCGPFDAHLDRFAAAGAELINFNLTGWADRPGAFFRARDPDLIVRTAERDPDEARELLLSMIDPVCVADKDWPDTLARDIRRCPDISLSDWAETRNLAPATLSRGFRRVYGLAPSAFRAQTRARRAWCSLMNTDLSLTAVSFENGFADQAHMTRALGQITGRTPSQWRRQWSNRFKT